MLDIKWQIRRTGFLAGLDHDDAARMRDALLLQRQQCRQACEHGIAVIGAAAAIKLAVLEQRRHGPLSSSQPSISGCLSR